MKLHKVIRLVDGAWSRIPGLYSEMDPEDKATTLPAYAALVHAQPGFLGSTESFTEKVTVNTFSLDTEASARAFHAAVTDQTNPVVAAMTAAWKRAQAKVGSKYEIRWILKDEAGETLAL